MGYKENDTMTSTHTHTHHDAHPYNDIKHIYEKKKTWGIKIMTQ